ncbi:hypothetical protein [Longimicrobium terrae]|uniref:Uncharacterized protein n=1 Tax=Longimicrobium terrae TaxID=1639882 RepID=A0A841GWH7_9BACT|nr:hypothetical protein [Longimicrobium terrae]MBB4635639.1 hypothetical protein [Longimicrobium terrae]MBB6070033.1 hypothetical protein [Longimicrobium terrae]NNC32939.1 hypothetical protein [Longimicrobium terrae]
MADRFDRQQHPLSAAPTCCGCTAAAAGLTYVSGSAGEQGAQTIQEETRRRVRRKIMDPCGREGIELIEEHHLVYVQPSAPSPREPDAVRSGLAAIVAFILIALAFTAAGGNQQSFALAPVYLGGFLLLWSWLA